MSNPISPVNPLLEKTISLFMRFGIRSVSMDDLAREAGVSKKTIYQHYQDRNDVVASAMRYHIDKVEYRCREIFDSTENPIDQLLQVGEYIRDMTRQMNPLLLYELQKYFPQVWEIVHRHRIEFISGNIASNIRNGIEMGLYRQDLNIDIVSRIYINLVDLIFNEEAFPKVEFTFKELHHEMILYHIHGISTPKGTQYLNEKQVSHD